MTQFIAIINNVEVNRNTVLAFVNSMESGKDIRLDFLLKNGIDPEKENWIDQQKWLNAFKDIATNLGEMNLFLIGKAIIDNATFPPVKDLKEGLKSIDIAYHINHRLNGQTMFDPIEEKMIEGIGHYTLTEYDPDKKKAIMVCDNPYPSKFDEGIITQIVRKFKPAGAHETIKLDTSKESRKNGAESCTFLISW